MRKRIKVWKDPFMIMAKDFTADGQSIRLDEGCLGFMAIWKSKAAAKRAGMKNTHRYVRRFIVIPEKGGE